MHGTYYASFALSDMLAASKHELLKHTTIDRYPKHFEFRLSREYCLVGIFEKEETRD